MMRIRTFIVFSVLVFLLGSVGTIAAAESAETSSIRQMVMTEEKKNFSFRNGVTWAMNPEQVSALESTTVQQQNSSDWAVLLTAEPVTVSRFTADLVYMFYKGALRMITYEFHSGCSLLNYQYLTGALCSVYGDSSTADPAVIKGWMDRIYQNYYRQDLIRNGLEWTAEDGTSIYLYYFTETNYAILYVCPRSDGGNTEYDTNGL